MMDEYTLKKALDTALAMQSAERDAQDLQPRKPVHALCWKEESPQTVCYRCDGDHRASDCRFQDVECHHCKKKGHIAHVCRSKPKPAPQKGRNVSDKHRRRNRGTQPPQTTHTLVEEPDDDAPVYTIFKLSGQSVGPLVVTMQVDQAELMMEVDTGAAVSLISKETYQTLWMTQNTGELRTGSNNGMNCTCSGVNLTCWLRPVECAALRNLK